jgi:hypothetical protein
LGLCGGAFLAACTDLVDEVLTDETPLSDSVQLIFDLPQCYAYGGFATRAGLNTRAALSDDDEEKDEERYFPDKNRYSSWSNNPLDEGSTVWISYRQHITAADGTETLGEEVMRPYVVRGLGDGYLSLYACQVRDSVTKDAAGNDPDTTWIVPNLNKINASPLYVSEGTYDFRILSPALPLTNIEDKYYSAEENKKYTAVATNGIYFCSSDERYINTKGLSFDVKANKSGVQRIQLHPLVWQVARLSFTLKKGSNVHSLEVMSTGIEVSGLQNPLYEDDFFETEAGQTKLTVTKKKIYFNWRSASDKDTIQMRLADKRAWVRIAGSECVTHADGSITADVGVLPTDAMSTNIVILFNLSINGIATQYETCLRQIRLYHGHDYHLKVTVDGTDNITVSNWSNQSWSVDAPFAATPSD